MTIRHNLRLLRGYALGLAGLRADDVIVTSFPKSGSTWVRFVLANLAFLRMGRDEVVDFALLDATLPEFGRDNLLRVPAAGDLPRFVKTHNPYWLPFAGKRAVVVVRDPRDTMVSYYKYEMARKHRRFDGEFDAFIRDAEFGVPAWIRHTRSWQARGTAVVRYEALRADDVGTVQALTERLGLGVPEAEVREAVERSRFERVKRIEQERGLTRPDEFREGFAFARSGKVGAGHDWFDDAKTAYLEAHLRAAGIDYTSPFPGDL